MNSLYVIDKDTCTEYDNIIQKGQCGDCVHYEGFKMYEGLPCICCEYYDEESNENQLQPDP